MNYLKRTQFHRQSIYSSEHAQIFTGNNKLLKTHTVPLTITINYCKLPQFHRKSI